MAIASDVVKGLLDISDPGLVSFYRSRRFCVGCFLVWEIK